MLNIYRTTGLLLALAPAMLAWAPTAVAQTQGQTLAKKQTEQERKAEAAKATMAPLAISDTHTQGLMQSFSDSTTVYTQKTGAQLYAAICQGCHMPQGEGAKGVGFYPPLASSLRLSAGAYPAVVILRGMHGMPAFHDRLSDAQVAEVVNYIRTHFGNNFTDAMGAAEVAALRKSMDLK